jgi:hypothetical protein
MHVVERRERSYRWRRLADRLRPRRAKPRAMHPATTTAAIRASLIMSPIMVPSTVKITETTMIAPITNRMSRNMTSLYEGDGAVNMQRRCASWLTQTESLLPVTRR